MTSHGYLAKILYIYTIDVHTFLRALPVVSDFCTNIFLKPCHEAHDLWHCKVEGPNMGYMHERQRRRLGRFLVAMRQPTRMAWGWILAQHDGRRGMERGLG